MRYHVACAILFAAFLSDARAGDVGRPTVLLNFEGASSPRAVQAIQNEVASLMKPAGLEFDYRLGTELGPYDTPSDIIIVKFKGTCRREMMSPGQLLDERGPFAFTHSSNGEILPFAEVACNRVQASIQSASGKLIRSVSDEILGRALGRVVAHELYHILARTAHHGNEGVARTGFTSSDLVAEQLIFSKGDLKKLHATLRKP